MKPKITLTIDGKEYPFRETLGAMSRFYDETGYDISQSKGGLREAAVYIYCCVVSACKKDGVEFPYSFTEFADSVDEDVLLSWRAAQDEAQRLLSEDMGGDSDGSKKKPR